MPNITQERRVRARAGRAARLVATVAVLGLALPLGACNELLSVENPGAIQDGQLNDPILGETIVQSVVSDFQRMYGDLAYYSAVITDEAVTGHNFETIKEMDLRIAQPNKGTLNSDIYTPLQRARFAGDSLSGRLRTIFGDTASKSLGLARALAYGAYSNMLLGEFMCEAPVDPESAALGWDELMQRSLERYDQAIAIAGAYKAAGGDEASADSIIFLASVGAARASLNLGDFPGAISYASGVPADFQFQVPHSKEKSYLENPFQAATTGNNRNLGVDESFRFLDDVRVTHTATSRTGHNGLTLLWTPYQPPSFGEWAPGANATFEDTTPIRFSSGLEARYIVAEAAGATQETVDFINERRKVGNPSATDITLGDDVMAELRDQRRRDFYLDGHRLGDLRRYIKLYSIDEFPSGPHPNVEWGNYGTLECFPLPDNETIGNPNA
jgi:hypothetical protein